MKARNVLFFQYPWRLWRERLAGIYRYAKKARWQVSIAEYGRNFESIDAALRFWRPDGLIVEGGYTELDGFRQSDFGGYPAVFCDARASRMRRPYSGVVHDSSATAMLAAKELLSLGFSDYAFVGNLQPRDWSERRRDVFSKAVDAAGGRLSIFETTTIQDFDAFRERLRPWLAALPRPCGLLAANDTTADIVLRQLKNMRVKVPDEIAVVGIDNDPLICENTIPTLTSVAPDFERSGYLAAAMAVFATGSVALAEDAYVFSPNGSGNNGVGVNTGYFMKPTSRIEVDFQYPTAPDGQFLFGEWGLVSDFGLSVGFWIDNSKFCFILNDNKYKSYSSTLDPDTARHTAIIDVPSKAFKLLSASGVEEWSGTAYNSTCNNVAKWPIVLFGSAADASGAGRQFSAPKIYSVKIYETENGVRTLVHDLVPCVKGRDAGFYDEKTDEFLYGSGAYELICGGDNVKTIPDDGYLQSSRSQSFNTGYYMTPTSRIEVSFQYPEAPTDNFLFGAWFNDNDHGLSSGCWNNSGKYGFICADGKYSNNGFNGTVSCSDTNRFTAVIDVASNVCQLVRNGYLRYTEVKGNTCANAAAAARPTVLFGSAKNEAGEGTQLTSTRIYSAKIYKRESNGTYTLKKNFVPYEKATVPGFMEKVSGVFTPVKGIASGGNIENDESASCAYVENGGTPAAALNLGYYANMTSRIEVDYKLLKTSGSRGIFGAWGSGDLHYCLWNYDAGKISFIFQGKGKSGNQSEVSGDTADVERHLAIMDFKNKSLAYVTDGVTNNVTVNASAQFNDTDVSSLPLYVFGFMKADEGPGMVAWSRIYSVRIYENDVLKHEFLPYTDGTTNTLRDIITGYVATKANPAAADLTIAGMGVDGEERCVITPQNATIRQDQSVTLKAVAVGAVSSYKWTCNGEAVGGGSNGELTVSWHESETPDVYAVTPVYSIAGREIEGEPVSTTVTNKQPTGFVILFH